MIFLMMILLLTQYGSGFVGLTYRSLKSSRGVQRLEMNIADRFFRVVKSNVNSVLSGLEDPEKVLDQAMDDMQRDLVKIRQSYAEISATQKRAEKKKEQADKMANDWYGRAQLALEAGDEELAREALSRRQLQMESVESLTKQIDMQAVASEKLFSSMSELDEKYKLLKGKKMNTLHVHVQLKLLHK